MLAADLVLFGKQEGTAFVLLIQRGWPPFKDAWALPGGQLNPKETFERAACREFLEETGLEAPDVLEPLGVWDEVDRDPRGRVISVAYLGVVEGLPRPQAGDDAAEAKWFPVTEVLGETASAGALAFDHAQILWIAYGRARLNRWLD